MARVDGRGWKEWLFPDIFASSDLFATLPCSALSSQRLTSLNYINEPAALWALVECAWCCRRHTFIHVGEGERAREDSEVGVFIFLYPSLLDHLGWWTVFLSLRLEPLQMALHLSEKLLGFSSHSLPLLAQVYHGTTPWQTECWTIPVVSLYPPLLFANRLFSKFLNLPVPTKTLYWYYGLG